MRRPDDARSLYATEADILQDQTEKKLTGRLHQPANRCSRELIQHLWSVERNRNGFFRALISGWSTNWYRHKIS